MKKIEQAGYIIELKQLRSNLEYAISNENRDNLWVDAAIQFPEKLRTNYMDTLSLLDMISDNDDVPSESLEVVIKYIEDKIQERLAEIIDFLKSRIETVDDNIKYLKKKFKKEWGTTYKEALTEESINNNTPMDIDDILDKISKSGMKSLTTEEKNFLRRKGE